MLGFLVGTGVTGIALVALYFIYKRKIVDQCQKAWRDEWVAHHAEQMLAEVHAKTNEDILAYTKLRDEFVRKANEDEVRCREAQKRLEELRNACRTFEDRWKALHDQVCKAEEDVNVIVGHAEERKRARLEELEKAYEGALNEYLMGWAQRRHSADEAIQAVTDKLAVLEEAERRWGELVKERETKEWKGRLRFTEREMAELGMLYGVCERLSNPLPVYKAIWSYYVGKAIGILVTLEGLEGVSGIYCITNTKDGKRYVGQSVNVGERWKQHAKRGCGAEVGTLVGGKLYKAMMQDGVWNFSFELLEKCDRGKLDERERWWIKEMGTVESGYNSKEG